MLNIESSNEDYPFEMEMDGRTGVHGPKTYQESLANDVEVHGIL